MAKIRLRYENGHFVPLDEVTGIQEGAEFVLDVEQHTEADFDAYMEMLDRTAGTWKDLDGIEEYLADARQKWDDEWQQRLPGLTVIAVP